MQEKGGLGIHLLWLLRSSAEVSLLGSQADYGIVTKPRLHIWKEKDWSQKVYGGAHSL